MTLGGRAICQILVYLTMGVRSVTIEILLRRVRSFILVAGGNRPCLTPIVRGARGGCH